GFNLVGSNEGYVAELPAGIPNINQDIVGTNAAPVNPGLNPLGDNGGPQFTMSLQSTSPAIDSGSCPTESVDQRGLGNNLTPPTRAVDIAAVANADDGCDIGAFESGASDTIFLDGFEPGDAPG
ncbi:MAG: choice-of-anchor Q domain-containing protein, partial [Pseudomonadota bacterium]